MSFKIAFIGAGSIGFTRGLTRDLLSVPEFSDIQIAFQDISAHNLDMVRKLVESATSRPMASRSRSPPPRIARRRSRSRRSTCSCVARRRRPPDAFKTDVEIPLKYGIDQCVGDTICAGGVMYGQRGVQFILDVCKDIKAVAASRTPCC